MIHIIPNGENSIIYCSDTMKYQVIPTNVVPKFLAASDGLSRTELMSQYALTEEACDEVYHILTDLCLPEAQMQTEQDEEDKFSTLILNVSNDCNMQCKYCFANHGTYQSAKGYMSVETAEKAVNQYAQKYHRIKEIKFFGGEPMMNISVIADVCSFAQQLYAQGVLHKLPRFKVITNGTIMTKQIIDMVNEYHINVVFSIDGPPEIHDRTRVYKNMRPSYSDIYKNFFLLRNATEGTQPCSVEVTYTNAHLSAGWSIADTVNFLYEEFHLQPGQVNVSLVNLDASDPLALPEDNCCWQNFAGEVLERLKKGQRFQGDLKLMGLIHRIKNHKPSSDVLCSAGSTWSAVSSSGEVYPCLMFIDQKEFCMGSVDKPLFSDEFQNISDRFKTHHKNENPCRECFAKQICNRCAGINRFLTGDISGNDPLQCAAMRETVTVLFRGIADGMF